MLKLEDVAGLRSVGEYGIVGECRRLLGAGEQESWMALGAVGVGMLDCWDVGVEECWSVGEYWIVAVLERVGGCCSGGVLEC